MHRFRLIALASRSLPRLLAGALLCSAFAARADLYVVVNASNQARLSKKDVLELYTGRTRQFPGGDFALAFDLPRDAAERGRFYKNLTGMDLAQVNSYWSRLMFSGQTMPPQPLPNEAAMVEVIRQNRGAIGYLTREPTDKSLTVVLVLKEAP